VRREQMMNTKELARFINTIDWSIGNIRKLKISTGAVFDTRGRPVCIMGHLIERSGFKRKMGPFSTRSYLTVRWQWQTRLSTLPKWLLTTEALKFVFRKIIKCDIPSEVLQASEDLQVSNDYFLSKADKEIGRNIRLKRELIALKTALVKI